MKRIYRMVLGSYVGPLVLTFFIAVFILLMQFLWLYIDILIGKGLEWKVIAELFFYASWTTVPMALPLSILLSSLMTFGNLGEHYELVAVKSAGISFWKTMRPLIILSVFISIFAFLFSNNALPYAELKRKSLVYDIQHKKLSFNIKAGEFYHDIDGYVIRVGRKDSKDEKILYDVLIYDHTDRSGGTKMTVARKGIMEMSPDGNNLVLELEDGWNYEESGTSRKESNQQTRPMQRIRYESQIMHFDISGFEMSRTDEELFKSNYNMLNIAQLNYAIDSLRTRIEVRKDDFVASYTNSYTVLKQPEILAADSVEKASDTAYAIVPQKPLDSLSYYDKKTVIATALNMTRNQKQSIEFFMTDLKNQETLLRKHEAVRHEKFTLSFACLVLFFIGAPLGSIIRKGGLGFPMIIATFLFIMFHIINMIGKKYAIAGAIPVWFGTWLSAIILFPFGLFLTLKASNDSPIFDLDSWKKIVYRFISKKRQKNENTAAVQ